MVIAASIEDSSYISSCLWESTFIWLFDRIKWILDFALLLVN